MQCCVPFCQTNTEISESAGITFHKFPSEVHLRAAWLRALGKQDTPLPERAVVCSQHFLSDDICTTESGSRQIRAGAIPSMVQVCMMCLDTHSKLFLMSKFKLDKAYRHLVGHPPCDGGNLKQTLCVQCAQRLVNFSRFRDKSLRARALMMELLEKHELISMQHMDTFNEGNNQLKHSIVKTVLDPDHCDLYINYDTDKQTGTASVESVTIKNEANVPMSVDEELPENVVLRTDTVKGFNIDLVVTKEEYLSDEEPKQLTDPLLVKPSTSKAPVDEPLAPIKYEITFECSICMEDFPDEDTYNYHMSMHMEENQNLTEEPSAEFGHSSSSVARVSAPARIASNSKIDTRIERDQKIVETTQKTPQAAISPVTNKSRTIESLTDHKPDKKQLKCIFCTYQNKNGALLVDHMKTHTGDKPFACVLCEYKCARKSDLVKHMIIHTELKPFSCDLCEYKCSRNSDLSKHVIIHTGIKPFSCELCGYRFARKRDLGRHMRTHTGEKPFACNVCGFKCSEKGNLSHHMKKHSSIKPFCCELCEYKTSIKSSLVSHMKTHTREKPFSCIFCEFRCSIKSSLSRHMKTHTSAETFCCTLCDYKCLIKRNLTRHVMVNHK